MDDALKLALAVGYAYLIGSVPMAYLIARIVRGIDIRQYGSGNVGSSNVWHTVGRVWIVPIGLFDFLVKGPSSVIIAAHLLDLNTQAQVVAGLTTIVGHNWPIFLGFKGGRGVAPTIGVLLVLARLELTASLVVSFVGWRLSKSSAPGVLIAALLLPGWSLLLGRPTPIVVLMLGILIINILKRLLANGVNKSGISWSRLMFNRLIFDRDISDNDAWVHQRPSSPLK